MKFKDLKAGDIFIFASEHDPKFRYSGMALGPWKKLTNRQYCPITRTHIRLWVGSSHVKVIPQSED